MRYGDVVDELFVQVFYNHHVSCANNGVFLTLISWVSIDPKEVPENNQC